jgi:hypothetical protein
MSIFLKIWNTGSLRANVPCAHTKFARKGKVEKRQIYCSKNGFLENFSSSLFLSYLFYVKPCQTGNTRFKALETQI